tara:strand:- start:324 stop:1238 length:915 start_codon:yes stop_codon:yes gene_type:complete
MKKIIKVEFILFLIFNNFLFSQDSLLNQIDDNSEEYAIEISAFKAHKIINSQSTKQSNKDELFLYVAHRFGNINDGIRTLFGLDIANTKIELMYGLTDKFQLGFSRESLKKTYSLSLKNKLLEQNSSSPLNLSSYFSFNYNSSDFLAPGKDLSFSQRSLFLFQFLISNRINDKISFQISPIFIKRNYNQERFLFIDGNVVFEDGVPVTTTFDTENNYALGLSTSYKLNKRTSLNLEYSLNFNRPDISPYLNPLSIGIDLETGGHVFQLIFSNTQSIDDLSVLLDAEGSWKEGDIFFGFNILRVF